MTAKLPGKQHGLPQLIQTMDCAVGVAVGNFVYPDSATDNLAIVAVDNTSPQPVIGRVRAKPTTTTCEVLLIGIISYSIARGRVYIDTTTGGLTTTLPTTDYVQSMGWSFGDGTVFMSPALQRIKRS